MKDRQWWSISRDREAPAVRWLGVFKRVSLIAAPPASLLTVPWPRGNVAGRTAAAEAPVGGPAHNLSVSSRVEAQLLPLPVFLPCCADAKTISLAGMLLDSIRCWTSPAQPRETAEDILWQNVGLLHGTGTAEAEAALALRRELAQVLQPPAHLLVSPSGPLEWKSTLFPYQIDGIRALLAMDAVLLADDMGLGKTIQAIAALRILAVQRRIERALLVVRAGLLSQWRHELRTWAPELRVSTVHGRPSERAYQWDMAAHVYLTTYETLRSDFTENPASRPRKRTWDVVILDEAQQIKNADAETSRKCKRLPKRRAWALTGTPLENRVEELASILEFVCPLDAGESPPRLRPGRDLFARHREVQIRRKKADVLPQLPPKTVHRISLQLTPSQWDSYRQCEDQGVLRLREMGEEIRVSNVLELILRLKQICNFCPQTGESAKLQDLQERLRTLSGEGHRALVFSQFTDGTSGTGKLASCLEEFRPLVYTGALGQGLRDEVVRTFKRDGRHQVLLLSIRAGGQGLNLQEASYVFHFDRWWNPAVEHQAEDRSHRMGQSMPVHVYKYTCENTIEERIEQILEQKHGLFCEIVDDVSIDLGKYLTAGELFGLFGLPGPVEHGPARTETGGEVGNGSRWEPGGDGLEQHVKDLLASRGWSVEMTPFSRDGGIDLVAKKQVEAGSEAVLFLQCKDWRSPAGIEVVRQLNGVLPAGYPGGRGVVVCPGGFTNEARAFAGNRGIALWDGRHLTDLAAPPDRDPGRGKVE